MKSKLIENLFFAGEIIDLHGPTGGYNLQLCWSTGYLAGQSAARKMAPSLFLPKIINPAPSRQSGRYGARI